MPIQWNMQSIGGILYVAVFSTMLASSCQNIAQKLAPTSHAALLMSLESVFGALSGVIFLGEKLTIRMGDFRGGGAERNDGIIKKNSWKMYEYALTSG